MSIPSLFNTYIDETYPRLVQVSGSEFADGLGNPISFGPGTLSGGTNGYIPLWSGSTALTSSYLYQSASVLKTKINGSDNGLSLDFINQEYALGVLPYGNQLRLINSTSEVFLGYYGGSGDWSGLYFDGNNLKYTIGVYQDNGYGTQFIVDDLSSSIETRYGTNNTQVGLSLDFANGIYRLGDPNGVVGGDAGYIEVTSIGFTVNTDETAINGNYIQVGRYDYTTDIDVYGNNITLRPTGSISIVGSGLTSAPQLNVLTIDTASGQLYYTASSAFGGGGGGGSTNPGGSNTQIQYNNNNSFGGVPTLTYNGTTLRATGSFSGSLTGALIGTASWADNATTASYVKNAQTASYVVTAQTASFVTSSNVYGPYGANSILSASYASSSLSSSYALSSSYSVSSSYALSSSQTVSASYALTASYVTTLNQNVVVSGAIRLDPTTDPSPAGNTFLSSSFLFQSSSNTSLGYDLYFRQDGNLVKWKWMEAQLSSGLLYGGIVTWSGSTFYISSGSGIVVNHNANTGSEINPIVTYVNWGPITASATNITSSTATWIGINSLGNVYQQNTPSTPTQYDQSIPLGFLNHQNRSTIAGFTYDISPVYDTTWNGHTFAQSFGALKLSGLNIIPQTGSLQLGYDSGQVFNYGAFYNVSPDSPSLKSYNAAATGSIFRFYRTGSGEVNVVGPVTTIDPGQWDDGSGTLQNVPGGSFTVQRVFLGTLGNLVIYYGQNIYNNLADAKSAIFTELFTESNPTKIACAFLGYIVVKGNAISLTSTSDVSIINSGLFRNTVGGSGGTIGVTTLGNLGDVSITSPSNNQALIYNGGTWINSSTVASASYVQTAQTASYVQNAQTASYVVTAQTASYVQNAQTASYVVTALTASYVTASNVVGTVTSASYALSSSYAANGGVTQIIAGTNITLSPTNGLGAVTINSTGGGSSGAGANVTSSFTNLSTWTFTHALANRGVVVQTYDTNWNQTIPQNIVLTDANTATITFPTNESGYAIATLGGVTSNAATASYVLQAVSSSFASTASYVNTLNQSVLITGSLTVGSTTLGPSENTITLGARDTTGEGGQVGFNASGGTYTSASFLDVYQDSLRILKGTNAGSTTQYAAVNLQTGNMTLNAGSIIMPSRPAFRVTGATTGAGADKSSGTIISGSLVTVDYNQGSNYNNTNGQFTCPLAGLYHVWYVGRTQNASLAAVSVLKNNTTVLAYWESNTNTGHFGTSAVVSLAANDVVTAKVTAGTITFDTNDNWGVAYIG